MCDRNVKSECILIILCALVFLDLSVKELPNFIRKYCLIAELLIFKHRRQNISVSNTVLLTAVTCLEGTLCCENPFDVLVICGGVGCCEQSGTYRLVFHWSRYKGERPVLSRCLASSTAYASHLRPLWWLLYFSKGQRSCLYGMWDHAAVNLWNTRLHCSSSVASQQSWSEPGRLPDLGEASQPDA